MFYIKTRIFELYCTSIAIGKVFDSFYEVPAYQREYVWEADNVRQLLNDISDNPDGYFIGALVVSEEKEDETYQLIDGQQRLTTLFLVLCALKSSIIKHGGSNPAIETKIQSVTTNQQTGESVEKPKLVLNYEKAQSLMVEATTGSLSFKKRPSDTTSESNIKDAYKEICEFLDKNYESTTDLNKFWSVLCYNVNIVRIDTESIEQAMTVFEVLNDRGVGLDSFDLLKNRLYQNVDLKREEDYIANAWESVRRNINEIEAARPLRFLRYFLSSTYSGPGTDKVVEKRSFDWIQKYGDRIRLETDPGGFIETLRIASNHYKGMLVLSQNHLREKSQALVDLNYFRTKSTRQHMAILLSCIQKKIIADGSSTTLSAEIFERLTRTIESVLFYAFMTKERSQSLEAKFDSWLSKFQLAETEQDVDNLRAQMGEDCEEQKNDFYERVYDSLSADDLTRGRLKYILAKFTQFFEKHAPASLAHSLEKLMDSSFNIEHIMPNNPTNEHLEELGTDIENYMQKSQLIGNLVLLEEPLNKLCQNKPYEKKKDKYSKSQLWLTKRLDQTGDLGNLSIANALRRIETFDKWNLDTIEKRQESLKSIAREIWSFD